MNTEITNISPNSENVWEPESALDILIVLLYSKGRFGVLNEPIEGITRLDKIMFLLSGDERFKSIINQGYTFEADNFGPFAPELFDDLEEENVRFGGYFSKDLLGTRFRLDAKPIKVAVQNIKKEMLQFSYNFNISLTQDDDHTKIIDLFNKWDAAKSICQELTNKINSKD